MRVFKKHRAGGSVSLGLTKGLMRKNRRRAGRWGEWLRERAAGQQFSLENHGGGKRLPVPQKLLVVPSSLAPRHMRSLRMGSRLARGQKRLEFLFNKMNFCRTNVHWCSHERAHILSVSPSCLFSLQPTLPLHFFPKRQINSLTRENANPSGRALLHSPTPEKHRQGVHKPW